MKAIITGMNGTVAPALAKHLTQAGHQVVSWNRFLVPIEDPDAIRGFIERERPDWFFHVATGSPRWAELAAQICAERSIRFLYTSSVSVYSAAQTGPFTVAVLPKPNDDYGRYKLLCEQLVQSANHEAIVARLGWQIGTAPGGNQMADYLERNFQTQGGIEASTRWQPACSFLEDTAAALSRLMQDLPAGLYLVDGNPGLSFHEIVVGLDRLLGGHWRITPVSIPEQNNRMIDERAAVGLITRHFQS
jgi:dTDP-4-dehydrorhamnose reductase